jgi:epoxyqueuosine reductase QueG
MDELRDKLRGLGASLVGYADLSAVPEEARDGLPFGVSIAVALDPAIVAGIELGPTPAYSDEYEQKNRFLDDLGAATARFLQEQGHRARALAAIGGSDPGALSTRLPHKTAATRSGLGWIGKCALLVTEQFGSAVRLVTVLTDAELPVGEPVDDSRCGDCVACVEACPGGAPTGKDWALGVHRDEFFDAFACRDDKHARARKIGIEHEVCGMCIAACPWTKKYLQRAGV